MPFNFYIIILVQIFVLLILSQITKKKITLDELFLSAIAGIVLGASFDIILSKLQLYTYATPLQTTSFLQTGLTVIQLIVNGLLSFGLAFATAKVLQGTTHKVTHTQRTILVTVYAIILLISFMLTKIAHTGTITLMFVCGTFILVLGELLLVFNNKTGPLSNLLITKNFNSSFLLVAQCAVIGILYEATNVLFPFWEWLPHNSYNRLYIEILIATLGYIPLLHPMIVFWQLCEKKNNI